MAKQSGRANGLGGRLAAAPLPSPAADTHCRSAPECVDPARLQGHRQWAPSARYLPSPARPLLGCSLRPQRQNESQAWLPLELLQAHELVCLRSLFGASQPKGRKMAALWAGCWRAALAESERCRIQSMQLACRVIELLFSL